MLWELICRDCKKLAKHYKNIDALRQATVMDLILVDEIGEKIAKSVLEF
jgi:DNA ligase (NAD+)